MPVPRRRIVAVLACLVLSAAGVALPIGAGVAGLAGLTGSSGADRAAAATTLGQPRLGTLTTLAGFGNAAGGTARTPADCGSYALTAISGFHQDAGDYLRGVSVACRPLLSDGQQASLGGSAAAGSVGITAEPVSETTACPAQSVATGVQGATGVLVDRLTLLCAPLNPDGTLGPASAATGITGGTGGSVQPDQSCAAGSIVVGVRGRSGDGLDFLQLDCAPLAFVVDHALHFPGGASDSRVAVAYDPLLEQPNTFTVEADVRWDGTSGSRGIASQPRADSAGGGLAEGYALLLQDGRPCFTATVTLTGSGTPTDQQRRTCTASALTPGTWFHLSGTYDTTSDGTASVVTVAVNGATTSRAFTPAHQITYGENAPFVIGRLFANDVTDAVPAAQLSGFGGDVDNVAVINGPPVDQTTIASWSFDEGTGTTTADSGVYRTHVGTLTGSTQADLPVWIEHDTGAGPDNTTWPTALTVTGGTSVDGALLRPGEARWYRFPVQPDARVQVDLTGLPADYDITLFKDIAQAFTTLTTQQDLTRLSAEFAGDAFAPSVFSPSVFSPSVFSPSVFSPSVFSPSVFSPSVFSPSVFSPSVFSPSVFSPSVFSPSVFSPSVFSPSVFSPSVFSPSVFSPSVFSPSVFSAAFSSAQTRSLIAVSARDGLADESVASATWDNTGYFYVRVIGRDGASSPSAYHLTVTTTGGACTTTLDPRTDLATVTGTPGSATTVVLTDYARMHGTAADVDAVRSRLTALAAATNGVVVDLATVPRLVALNQQADAVKDCPYAKNLVAQAARDIVNSYRAPDRTAGALRYVVVAGGDDVVPFFRYPDAAGLGPENGYVPPVADATASQASLRRNTFLSQDAYGAATDVSLKSTVIPVPDVAVGRLVETPAEIGAAVDRYLALPGGSLPTATSSLVTGYDFLTDAADNVEATLRAGIPNGRNDSLITDQGVPPSTTTGAGGPTRSTSWTADDLRRALLTSRHDVTFLAGHFSANSALAADYSTQLVTTELASAPAGTFANTVVISAGCHSGYNLLDGDGVPGLTLGLDWAQAFAQQGATLVAGTGYQYGDTDFLEYSERLYAGLAAQLRQGSGPIALGTALTKAKQAYLSDTPVMRGIHVKALMEATLYGLPMLGVDLPSRVPAPAGSPTVTPTPVTTGPGAQTLADGTPGLALQQADLHLAPSLTTRQRTLTGTGGGSVTATYLEGPDGVVTNPAEPALPLATQDVTVPGTVLRGVGWRGGTYTDTDGITPLTGAPATELNSVHAPFASSAFFPSKLFSINYFGALADPTAGATRLSLTPAQHRSDAPGSTTDTLRQYGSVDLRLFWSSNIGHYGSNVPALAAAPSISGVGADAGPDGGAVPVRLHVVGDPSAGVQQVWVTFTGEKGSPLHGTWASVDLTQDDVDSTLWTGSVTLPAGQRSSDVRFLVQAVNGVGLVAEDDNAGAYYTPGATAPVTVTTAAPSSLSLAAAPTSGTYGTSADVSATLSAASGPIAGRPVTFTLGTASGTAVTGADGVASVSLPLLDTPGDYALQASFDGDATSAPSISAPRTVTIGKRATALALAGTPAAVAPNAPGQDPGITATLTDTLAGVPVRAHSVYLALTDAGGVVRAGATRTTDVHGTVALGPIAVGLAPGAYTVTATFGDTVTLPSGATTSLADPVYQRAAAAGALTVASPGPARLTATGGGTQTGTAGQPFDLPLTATAVDASGRPVGGTAVTFTVASGSASFTNGSASGLRTVTVQTNAAGVATSPALVAGTAAGSVTVTATAGPAPVTAALTATYAEKVVTVANARADLQVSVAAPVSVARGSTFTATVTVRNAGPNTAAALVTGLTPGSPLTVVSAPGATLRAGVWTWTAPGLSVGGSLTYTVTLRASTTKAATGALAAATLSTVPDPKLTNNAAVASVKIT